MMLSTVWIINDNDNDNDNEEGAVAVAVAAMPRNVLPL
jgi:hypothetical protein